MEAGEGHRQLSESDWQVVGYFQTLPSSERIAKLCAIVLSLRSNGGNGYLWSSQYARRTKSNAAQIRTHFRRRDMRRSIIAHNTLGLCFQAALCRSFPNPTQISQLAITDWHDPTVFPVFIWTFMVTVERGSAIYHCPPLALSVAFTVV